jgi:hypothetical protein
MKYTLVFLLGMFVGANVGIVVASMIMNSKDKTNCNCYWDLKSYEKRFIQWWRNHPNYRPLHITGPDWISGGVGGRIYSDRPNMQEIKKRR